MTSLKDRLMEILDDFLESCTDEDYSAEQALEVKKTAFDEAATQILALFKKEVMAAYKKVDRFEVIDDTGRSYVKGSIYGSPVSVELSLQDDDRTLKVFVKERLE